MENNDPFGACFPTGGGGVFKPASWYNIPESLRKKEDNGAQRADVPPPTPADYKSSNPKDRAATARLDLSLVPDTAVAFFALAMTEGDLKYGGYNFREVGVSLSTYVAACRRHLAKFYNGSDVDPKTLVHHLANAGACICVMIDGVVKGNCIDDRPPPVDMERLFADMEQSVKHLQGLFPNGPGRYTAKGQAAAQPQPVSVPGPVLACELDEALSEAEGD